MTSVGIEDHTRDGMTSTDDKGGSATRQAQRIGDRHRLPNRRRHEVIEFDHGGFRYTAGLGRFDEGEPS